MYTVDDMIRTLRSKLQEQNNKKVSDQNILDTLNQAQDFAFDIIARRYPDSIAANEDATINADGITFNVPENAFEQRLTKVYRFTSAYSSPLIRVDYREVDDFDSVNGYPTHYAIVKNKVHLLPKGDISSYTYRYAYIEDVEKLVKPQGRVNSFEDATTGGGNASITVDVAGSDLTNDVTSLSRFVNVIDGQSGLVKVSLEIQTVDTTTGKITFKSTLSRTKVHNKTISADITTDIEADDYICLVEGSCVPYFKKPAYNYILQFATTEIKRSLGMDAQQEEVGLRKYEEQLEKVNSNRESTARVSRRRSRNTTLGRK